MIISVSKFWFVLFVLWGRGLGQLLSHWPSKLSIRESAWKPASLCCSIQLPTTTTAPTLRCKHIPAFITSHKTQEWLSTFEPSISQRSQCFCPLGFEFVQKNNNLRRFHILICDVITHINSETISPRNLHSHSVSSDSQQRSIKIQSSWVPEKDPLYFNRFLNYSKSSWKSSRVPDKVPKKFLKKFPSSWNWCWVL